MCTTKYKSEENTSSITVTVTVRYLHNFFDEVTDEPDDDDPLTDGDRRHGTVRRQFSQHEIRQHGKESQV